MDLIKLVSLSRAELIAAKILSNIIYFLKNQLRQCIFLDKKVFARVMGGWRMEGGDFSRGMGQEEDPEIYAGGHFIYSGVGSHTMGRSIYIFDYERGML